MVLEGQETYVLAMARLAVLTLRAVDEGRRFFVEAVQTVRLLVNEGVILRNKLPANL